VERGLLRKQVLDERDRGFSLSSKVVCLTDRLEESRRKSIRLEEANEKLMAKKPVALSWGDHCLLLRHFKREFGHARMPCGWPFNRPLATRCQQQQEDHCKWEANRNFGALRDPPMSERIREELGFQRARTMSLWRGNAAEAVADGHLADSAGRQTDRQTDGAARGRRASTLKAPGPGNLIFLKEPAALRANVFSGAPVHLWPLILFRTTRMNGRDDDDDDTLLLERFFCSLSTLEDPTEAWLQKRQQGEGATTVNESLPGRIMKILTGQEQRLFPPGGGREKEVTEWDEGLQVAARLIQKGIPPLELHDTVVSSIVFVDDENEGPVTFHVTCLLLCCVALIDCREPIPNKKVRRWQFTVFETIRLFQRYFLRRTNQSSTTITNAAVLERVVLPLWHRHILPAVIYVQNLLEDRTTLEHSQAFVAGVVHCDSVLAAALCRVGNLVKTSFCPMLGHYEYDALYPHVWRRLRRGATNSMTPEEIALTYFTIKDDEEDEQVDEIRRERVSHMETLWSDQGIAVLVAASWNNMRPLVWSHSYTWKNFFPYVSILLLGEDSDDDDDADDLSGDIQIQLSGYRLLENLQTCPDRCLHLTSPTAPDSPVGTFQLLSNRMLLVASSGRPGPSAILTDELPDAAQTYQWMKKLIRKYVPKAQVSVIQQLVQDCPHPGLHPKLLDLLQDFVNWDAVTMLEIEVWGWIDQRFLQELESHVKERSKGNFVIQDAESVIQNVELYGAALGLMHRWILLKKTPPLLQDLSGRLSRCLTTLQLTQQSWLAASPPPAEHYRLDVLESSLQRTLELLEASTRDGLMVPEVMASVRW
jgi:hypothetical protein